MLEAVCCRVNGDETWCLCVCPALIMICIAMQDADASLKQIRPQICSEQTFLDGGQAKIVLCSFLAVYLLSL